MNKLLLIAYDAKGSASVLAVAEEARKAFAGIKTSGELPKNIVRAELWDRDHGMQAVALPKPKPSK